MKKTIHKFSRKVAILGLVLASANMAGAQTTSTTTTRTTSSGTVQEFSPDTFTVTSNSSTSPAHYTYTKTTSYVDENGNPVSVETVKSGQPVTVFYEQNGDQMVATKVVVKKTTTASTDGYSTTQSTTTSSTTSSQGTVSSFGPDSLAISSDSASAPVSFAFSKTVTYVDENGNPVSVETVKSGVPVTVFYTQEGDRMVATRVVVRTADSNAEAVEHKKTTTTTTETTPAP